MATASINHSILANHVSRVRTQTPRNASFSVRCMAEEKQPQQPMTTSSGTTPPPAAAQTPVETRTFPPPRAAPKKMSTKFGDLLAFSGPAPERINGRLAMIGFVAAMGVEVARGTDVAAQLADGGLPWFVITSVVLSVASLIPLSQGVSVESKSDGLMSSSAEMWNGRAAMLGLVALVLTEVAKGGALI
ncbi:hypothetical protein C5167_023511 [Papaver somniferum]|uniref:Uncharacterized protein n=1 Tax=Papaver somniferum TaxID=3469 RepID=A0A4Y7JQ28_PAPSO|nr:early light-induced protein 1, chloroplastic-like [Papaver somniferum]RZC61775.1 hypothetical protein C5167_023511 [Papaver somniferum]